MGGIPDRAEGVNAEYIEREAALRDWPLCDEPADAYQFIRNYPAADVRPVKRGTWIARPYMIGNTQYCSLCGENYGMKHNFCPNCGADMREES